MMPSENATSYIPSKKYSSFQDKSQGFLNKLKQNAKVASDNSKNMRVRISSDYNLAKQQRDSNDLKKRA